MCTQAPLPSPKGASKPHESIPPAVSLNWPNLLAYVFIYTQKVTPEGEIQTHAWNTSLAGNSLLFPVLARASLVLILTSSPL